MHEASSLGHTEAVYEGWRRDALVVLTNLAALGWLVYQLRDPRREAVRIEAPATAVAAATATVPVLRVYVTGAVERPGIVTLRGEPRVADAVLAAGGLAPDAAGAAVNLAAWVQDGAHVHVPAESETAMAAAGSNLTSQGEGNAPRLLGVMGSGTASGSRPGGSGPQASAGRLNINTATAAELEQLPGIGPALAERIVAYREVHGPFRSVDEMLAVSGIGEKTLARFADRISVQ